MTLQQRVPLLRDMTCLLAGLAGFAHSVVTHAGPWPLLVSAVLMAGPGMLQFFLAGITPGGMLSSQSVSSEQPSQPGLESRGHSEGEA